MQGLEMLIEKYIVITVNKINMEMWKQLSLSLCRHALWGIVVFAGFSVEIMITYIQASPPK